MKVATDLDISAVGEGRPLLWAHGLTSSREGEDQARLFPWPDIPGVRWVRYDARGHGRSPAPTTDDDCRWDCLAGDLLAVADEVGAARFIAGGASMGCATTLHAAVTAPERIEAMLLVIPPTAWETRAAQAHHYSQGARLLDAGDVEGLLATLEESLMPPMFQPFAEQARKARRESFADVDPASLARVFRGAAASDLPPRDTLSKLDAPSLILAWEGDDGHPVSTAEELAGLLPSAELHVASDLSDVFGWRDYAAAWLAALPEADQ